MLALFVRFVGFVDRLTGAATARSKGLNHEPREPHERGRRGVVRSGAGRRFPGQAGDDEGDAPLAIEYAAAP